MRGKYRKLSAAINFVPTTNGITLGILVAVTLSMSYVVVAFIDVCTKIQLTEAIVLYPFGYVAALISIYVRNKNSATKIIPLSGKEWMWSYFVFMIKMLLGGFLLMVLLEVMEYVGFVGFGYWYEDLYGNRIEEFGIETICKIALLIGLGIRIMGISLITFGMKQKWIRVVAVILGYVIFTATTILELNAWYDIKPIAVPICLTLLVSLAWAAIGFVITYYRIKPRKYEAS